MTDDTTVTSPVPLEEETEAVGFDVVLRGYDRTQVDRHVAWLEDVLAAAEEQAAKAEQQATAAGEEAARARREAASMQAQLERGRPTFEALGERVGRMLTLAEQEGDALRAAARAEAGALQGRLQQHEASAAKEREARHLAAQQEAAAIVRRAHEEANRVVTEARRHAAASTSAAKQQVDQLAAQREDIRAELTRLRDSLVAAMKATGG